MGTDSNRRNQGACGTARFIMQIEIIDISKETANKLYKEAVSHPLSSKLPATIGEIRAPTRPIPMAQPIPVLLIETGYRDGPRAKRPATAAFSIHPIPVAKTKAKLHRMELFRGRPS